MEWQLISDSSREGKMSSAPEAPTRLEDVQDIMKRNSSSSFYDGKNDVTCGRTGEEAAIETALSREMRQNHARKTVGGRKRRKGGGGDESTTHLGFRISVKK